MKRYIPLLLIIILPTILPIFTFDIPKAYAVSATGTYSASSASWCLSKTTSVSYAASGLTPADGGCSIGSFIVGQNGLFAPEYVRYRGFIRFDTSGLTDSANITGAKLELKMESDQTTTDFIVRVQKWTAASDGLSNNDYQSYDGVNYDDGATSTTGWTVGTSKNITITNFAIINKTGFTDLVIRDGRDINATAPTAQESFSSDVFVPKLYLTYTYQTLNIRVFAADGTTGISSIQQAYIVITNTTGTFTKAVSSNWANLTGLTVNQNVVIKLQVFNNTNSNGYTNVNQSISKTFNMTADFNRVLLAEVRQDSGGNVWIAVGSGLMTIKGLVPQYMLEPYEATVNSTKYTSQSSEWTYSSAGGNYLFRLAKSTFGQGNLSSISLDTTNKILSWTSTNSTTTWNVKWQAPQQDGGGGGGGGGGGLPSLPSLNFTLPAIAAVPPPDPKLVTAGALTVSLIITVVLVYNQIQARLRPSLKWAGIQAKSNSKRVKWKRGRWSKRFG